MRTASDEKDSAAVADALATVEKLNCRFTSQNGPTDVKPQLHPAKGPLRLGEADFCILGWLEPGWLLHAPQQSYCILQATPSVRRTLAKVGQACLWHDGPMNASNNKSVLASCFAACLSCSGLSACGREQLQKKLQHLLAGLAWPLLKRVLLRFRTRMEECTSYDCTFSNAFQKTRCSQHCCFTAMTIVVSLTQITKFYRPSAWADLLCAYKPWARRLAVLHYAAAVVLALLLWQPAILCYFQPQFVCIWQGCLIS